jgi:hypothetical protein
MYNVDVEGTIAHFNATGYIATVKYISIYNTKRIAGNAEMLPAISSIHTNFGVICLSYYNLYLSSFSS